MLRGSIVLIDGEHYPPVVARAIEALRVQGTPVALALMVGGTEKIGSGNFEIGVPIEAASDDPERSLADAIDRIAPASVIDLSDEPVLGYEARCRLASVALWKGIAYRGADFEFTPPPRPRLATAASIGIFGSGKRSGKTAVGGTVARVLRAAGARPVVVAMGRGGPPEPEVLSGENELTADSLRALAAQGRHASSDYIEDALTARVPTVGAWRAGGGMAGATCFHNYEEAIKAAGDLNPGILVLEGSGAAIPPVHFDAGIFIVDARIDPAFLRGYFGLYRVLLADLVVLTMCEEYLDGGHVAEVEKCIRSSTLNQPPVIHTVFRPHPLQEIEGESVRLATTANRQASDLLKSHLEGTYGVTVAAATNALSDRSRLRSDLEAAPQAQTLLVELKAAAVDVASSIAADRGMKVVFLDNRPEPVRGGDLEAGIQKVAEAARERHA